MTRTFRQAVAPCPTGRTGWRLPAANYRGVKVTVDGLEVACETHGDGPPLLLLHGAASAGNAWSLNVGVLSNRFNCIVPDLPGCGQSPPPPAFWSVAAYGRFLTRLLDVLGVDRAHVMGNSFGAVLAVELGATQPQRVDRLVLVAPPPVDAVHQGHTVRALMRLVDEDGKPRYTTLSQMRMISPHASEAMMALANENLAAGADVFFPVVAANATYPYSERVPRIQAPTLLVWGAQDGLVPLTAAPAWRELLTCPWEDHVFDGAGHCPQFDVPLLFNPRVKRFLAKA